ncbi:MAG: carboxypeptidase regulatory-like domain-containing protein [Terracidiphilus sp.]
MIQIRNASNVNDHFENILCGRGTTNCRWMAWLLRKRLSSSYHLLKAGLIPPLAMLVMAIAFLPGTKLRAQTGTINGTVIDPTGAVISGAKVRVVNEATGGVARDVVSDDTGTFRATNLTPSTYTLKVSAPGMEQLVRTGVVLDPDQNLGLGQLKLSLGQTSQTLTVSTETPTIDTTSSNNAAVIDERQVVEQPLNGRDFESLLTTTPGVVTNNQSQFRLVFNQTDDFYVNGMRGTDNNFFLDGVINTDIGANDGEYTDLSLDAVGEFKTLTGNYNAEYGRSPGVMILVNTKSGGKTFHGTVYEFNRNTDYDANDWFSNHDGLARAILRFNQFGGNAGGYIPIPKISPRSNKKAFFFFNYEGTRASRPNGGTFYTVPQPSMLGLDSSGNPGQNADLSPMYRPGSKTNPGMCDYNGTSTCTPIIIPGFQSQPEPNAPQLPPGQVQDGQVFQPGTVTYNAEGEINGGTPVPGNIIPASQITASNSQYAAMIADFKPAYKGNFNRPTYNNGYDDEQQVNFQDTYVFYKNQYAARVDYNFGPKANAFFRYVDDRQEEHEGFGIFSGPSFPVLPLYRKKPGKSWAWSLVNVISPTLTNEATVGWLHLTQVVDIVPGTNPDTYDKTKLGFTFSDLYPATNTHNLAPALADGTYLNTGVFPAGWTSTGNTLVANDDVTKIWKDHVFKFGIMGDLNENGQEGTWQENVSLSFAASNQNPLNSNGGLANMLLGNATTTTQSNVYAFGAFHMFQYEGYFQDTWKALPRLTLDLGVRYQFLGPTYTAGKYHQYYFEPNFYSTSQAVTINTAPNIPGSAPTQGSICGNTTSYGCTGITVVGNPYNGMVREGTDGLPKGGLDFRYNNVGPRLGFAWDVFGNGKTAVRGGYGLFYERYQQNTFNFGGISNPPNVYTPTIYGGNIGSISTSEVNGTPLTPSGGVLTVNQKGMIPTTTGFNLGVEQVLPFKMALDASYIGNQSRHQIYLDELEQLPLGYTTNINPGALGSVNNVSAALLPYKGYSSIRSTTMGASSGYNGLQFKLIRRFSNSLTFNADYTYAKAVDLDDVDSDGDVFPDYTQLKQFYAPAGYDRRNVANFQYVYNLPDFKRSNKLMQLTAGGWEVSGTTQFWSGTPCLANNSPTSDSCDLSSSGNLGDGGFGHIRPDYVGGQISTSHSHSQPTGQFPMWYNPAVFAVPANGTFGNFRRNSIYGPGVDSWNFSMYKNFEFTENSHLQLRFEGYNVFNHTQWGTVNNTLSASGPAGTTYSGLNAGSSGQITTARDPRQLQLAGKIYF